MTSLSISDLSLTAAVAATEALRLGAFQPAHPFGTMVPFFMLDVTAASSDTKQNLRKSGFQHLPENTEDDEVWMVWLPEEYRSVWKHPYQCDCMECRDMCCCGLFQRQHNEEHTFVSMGWHYKHRGDETDSA